MIDPHFTGSREVWASTPTEGAPAAVQPATVQAGGVLSLIPYRCNPYLPEGTLALKDAEGNVLVVYTNIGTG